MSLHGSPTTSDSSVNFNSTEKSDTVAGKNPRLISIGRRCAVALTSLVMLALVSIFCVAYLNVEGSQQLYSLIGGRGNDSRLPVMQSALAKEVSSDRHGKIQSDLDAINCSVQLAAPHTFPIVALASIPGSGNTWARHLIQQATGFSTGSVYKAPGMAENGFPGETADWTSGTTVVVKTHAAKLPGKGLITNCTAAILLLRNPIDVAITERNRRNTRSKTGVATWYPNLRFNPAWERAVKWQQKLYERFVRTWCGLEKPLLVIHYDNMKENPVREMERVVKFLNLTVSGERMACVETNTEGGYHRDYADKRWIYENVITEKMKTDALEVMEAVSEILEKRGLDPVPWKNIPHAVLPSFYRLDFSA